MEVRTIEELMLPDRRTARFGPIGLMIRQEVRPAAAAQFVQGMIATHDLSAGVPLDIRGHFETARRLHVYGLFVYEFFTVAADRALFTCELALRRRYTERRGQPSPRARPPALRRLLSWAKEEGLLSPDHSEEWFKVLADLRNFAAHPKINRIVSPADSARMLEVAASLINELWDADSADA